MSPNGVQLKHGWMDGYATILYGLSQCGVQAGPGLRTNAHRPSYQAHPRCGSPHVRLFDDSPRRNCVHVHLSKHELHSLADPMTARPPRFCIMRSMRLWRWVIAARVGVVQLPAASRTLCPHTCVLNRAGRAMAEGAMPMDSAAVSSVGHPCRPCCRQYILAENPALVAECTARNPRATWTTE